MKRNIKLTIAYDGTDFLGWERQKAGRTVQGEIEAALARMHKHPVALTGAGRTDAGVHARGQAANFRTDIAGIPAERFVPALNSALPADVRITAAAEAPDDFHARFSAASRAYRYFFVCGREALPWEKRYNWQIRRRPDIATLNACAARLRGETDCAAFGAAGDKSRSTLRFLYRAVFFEEDGRLVFEIRANAFLWHMVRSLAGTLIGTEAKYGARGPDVFRDILASRERALAGPTAPPQGLFLWDVAYTIKA